MLMQEKVCGDHARNFFFFAKPGVNLIVNVFINSFNIITNYKVISLDNLKQPNVNKARKFEV